MFSLISLNAFLDRCVLAHLKLMPHVCKKTGTAAGDPLETSAIGATFGKARHSDQPLLVGSIKTNIGHLEGASGLAGLIKSVKMLEQGLIPPNLWFEKVNPRIHLKEWGIDIPTSLTPWPTQGLRRISVNR